MHVSRGGVAAGGDLWVDPSLGFHWLVEYAIKTAYNEMDLHRMRLVRGMKVRIINITKPETYPAELMSDDTLLVPVEC